MKPEGEAETFGAKLARLREERSLTRYALAKQTGISQAGLAKLEQEEGAAQPSWDTVQKIALALGVDCSTFLDASLALPEEQPAKPRGRPRKATGDALPYADQAQANEPPASGEATAKRGRPRKAETPAEVPAKKTPRKKGGG